MDKNEQKSLQQQDINTNYVEKLELDDVKGILV